MAGYNYKCLALVFLLAVNLLLIMDVQASESFKLKRQSGGTVGGDDAGTESEDTVSGPGDVTGQSSQSGSFKVKKQGGTREGSGD